MNNNNLGVGGGLAVIKPIVFKLSHRNPKPATEGRYYPGIQRVPSEDTIFDPVTKKSKAIRYSVGEESIFRNEQPSGVELTDIIFTNGSLRVYEDNPTLLAYLRACNWNQGNKSRVRGKNVIFYEYNPQEIAKIAMEREDMEVDARYKAKTMKFSELKDIAVALGINVNRSAEEVRHDMMVLAKNRPSDFLSALDDPATARKVEILELVELGIIEYDPRAIYAKHGANKEHILTIPIGAEAIAHLVQWTLTDKEGVATFGELLSKKEKMLS